MTEGTENGTFITLDFSGTEKKFAGIVELHEFMRSQWNAWSWLKQATREDKNLDKVWCPFDRYLKQISQFIERYQQHSNDEKEKIDLICVFRNQTQTVVDQGFILAEAPNACFILDLKDNKSYQIAGYALALLNNVSINLNTSTAYKGSYWAMQYLSESTRSTAESQPKTSGSIMEAQIAKQASDFKNFINVAKNELTNIGTSLGESIALESSIKYWKNKRVLHQKMMAYAACATIVFVILTGGVFFWSANMFLGTTIAETNPVQFVIVLTVTTISVWLTHVSAKVCISNLHLRMDADERTTMIRTYLSLLS